MCSTNAVLGVQIKGEDVDIFLKGGAALDINSVRKKPKVCQAIANGALAISFAAEPSSKYNAVRISALLRSSTEAYISVLALKQCPVKYRWLHGP